MTKLKRLILLFIFIFIFLNIFSLLDYLKAIDEDFIVRVSIFEDQSQLNFYIKGEFKCIIPFTEEVFFKGNTLNTVITPFLHGIKLENKKYKIFGLKFIPIEEEIFYVNNMPYRGNALIFRDKNNKLKVINYVNISDYLKGVLYNEISPYWPMDAIKAQSVASRSFALYESHRNRSGAFDMRADVRSQVYRGINSERFRTNIAVDNTNGEVLAYNSKIFPAFFHACSGGYTEYSKNLWGGELTLLEAVKDDFSSKSPYFNWEVVLTKQEIGKKINDAGYKIGDILDILILKRNDTYRTEYLMLVAEKRNFLISAQEFRRVLGYEIIRSTNFNIDKKRDNFILKGHGWGHGVGMSQWGAYSMAKKGYNYKQILKYYYPKAELKTINILD